MGHAAATANGKSRPNRPHYANLTELLHALAAFLIGLAIAVSQYFLSEHAYFWDDLQAVHIPAMRHIGDALAEGRVPILTLGVWQGGNLFGEHYHGLANPFHLALYLATLGIDNLRTVAAIVVGGHVALLAGGAFVLARSYGASRPVAQVAATAVATNNFIAYWFAFTWFPAMTSTAWLIWAWAFLLRAHRSAASWIACAVLSWLTLTSGWPYASVILVVIAAVCAFHVRAEAGGRSWLAPVAAVVGAVLLAMPAFVATLAVASAGDRGLVHGNRDVLVPNLADALQVSVPFHIGHLVLPSGHGAVGVPIFLAAWFILPLMAYLRWPPRPWPTDLVALGTLAALFLLGTQGPEAFGVLRWPFKFLPYFQIALILLFLLVLDRYGLEQEDGRRWKLCLLLCVGAALLSSFSNFTGGGLVVLTVLVLFLPAILVVRMTPSRRLTALAVLAGVTIGCFGAARLTFPHVTTVGHYGMPEATDTERLTDPVPRSYTLTIGSPIGVPFADRFHSFSTGLMPLEAGHASINGYSPIRHGGLTRMLCLHSLGDTCPVAGSSALAVDPGTGVPLVDLMRVDRLVVRRGEAADAMAADVDGSWTLAEENDYAHVLTRPLPNADLPGTLAWTSPGVEVAPTDAVDVLTESVEVLARGGGDDRLVFARLWWPGYEATIDGTSVEVEPYRDVFVSVVLPPGQVGGLVRLSYRPPYAMPSILFLVIGAAVVAASAFRHRSLFGVTGRLAGGRS